MPIYTYECPAGHRWEEQRLFEGAEGSAEPCKACMESYRQIGVDAVSPGTVYGKKVPSRPSVNIPGGTPTHYPLREHK